MDMTTLLIQIVSGALGGHAAGAVSKDTNLGTLGTTIVGALGGGIGGQILSGILTAGGAAAVSGLDLQTIITAFLSGGVSGGLTTLVFAFLKSRMAA